MRDFINIMAVLVLSFILVASLIYAGVAYDCAKYGDLVGLDSKTVSLECYVKSDKGWLQKSTYEVYKVFGKF